MSSGSRWCSRRHATRSHEGSLTNDRTDTREQAPGHRTHAMPGRFRINGRPANRSTSRRRSAGWRPYATTASPSAGASAAALQRALPISVHSSASSGMEPASLVKSSFRQL